MTDFDGAVWRKASASTDTGNCVEVAYVDGGYGMRDSKDPHGPALRLTPAAWNAFLSGVRAGEFDSPAD